VIRLRVRGLIAALVVLAAVTVLGPSAGAVAQARPAALAGLFAANGRLDDVTALSASNA
jgi:hypothetical protein